MSKPVEIHIDPYEGKVVMAKRGLIGFGWCCAPKSMSIEEVQRAVHRELEPYIPDMGDGELTPWTVVRRVHSDPEWVSPGRCADSENRQHWFMIGGMSGAFMLAMMPDEEGSETAGIDPDTRMQTPEDYEEARRDTMA